MRLTWFGRTSSAVLRQTTTSGMKTPSVVEGTSSACLPRNITMKWRFSQSIFADIGCAGLTDLLRIYLNRKRNRLMLHLLHQCSILLPFQEHMTLLCVCWVIRTSRPYCSMSDD